MGCLPQHRRLPISEVLLRLSSELQRMGAQGKQLEEAIAHSINDRNVMGSTISAQLQSIDHIVQSISALGQFLGQLSGRVASDDCVEIADLLHSIPLRDLAAALSSGQTAATPSHHQGLHGDVDLF